MDKYVIPGAKKILSLTRTKIRLAKESDTTDCDPSPLPLVSLFSGEEVGTVAGVEKHLERLKSEIDFEDEQSVASTVLQCMDMIEGVKYKFEPREYMSNLSRSDYSLIEKKSLSENIPVNLLIMTKRSTGGLDIYVGSDPPKGVYSLSRVPTSLSVFLAYAFSSDHFTLGGRLRNVVSVIGHRTLITNAIHYSLGVYGAILVDE